jgi:NAD(P)-dependent dehydrogenase (short-subunit alcohol dehydrogenase family)
MTTTALITGGTSGIGRAVANKLGQMGVHVLVVGRNVERGEKTIAEIRTAGGQADFISSDLRDASSARQVARRAVELGNGAKDATGSASDMGRKRRRSGMAKPSERLLEHSSMG